MNTVIEVEMTNYDLCSMCGALVRVMGIPDFPGGEVATMHYEPACEELVRELANRMHDIDAESLRMALLCYRATQLVEELDGLRARNRDTAGGGDSVPDSGQNVEQVKPDWWPKCPWPEDVWTMTRDEYVEAIPDGKLRTAISGLLMRKGWEIALEDVWEDVECELERIAELERAAMAVIDKGGQAGPGGFWVIDAKTMDNLQRVLTGGNDE